MLAILLLSFSGCSGEEDLGFGGQGSSNHDVPKDSGETDSPDDSSSPDDTAAPADGVWELMVDGLEQGMLASGWSDGQSVLMAGGEINNAGAGFIAHWKDGALCVEEAVSEHALWWVHGASADRYYAVGEGGVILRHEDGVWTDESPGDNIIFYGMFDAGSTAWAVGNNRDEGEAQIWRRQSGDWDVYRDDLEGQLYKTWCASDDQCVFVGSKTLYMLDGEEWSETSLDDQLWTCRGRDWSDIWCVGGNNSPVVYHWDGKAWSEADTTGLGVPLFGVWTGPGEDVWVGGAQGVAARWDGTQWISEIPLTNQVFHGVWKEGDDVYFLGGNLGTSGGDYYGVVVHYGPTVGAITPTVCE